MEDLILRFPHIAEQIFEYLDNKSLTNAREVTSSWKKFIDDKKLAWFRICEKYCHTKQNNNLHIAAKTGQTKVFEIMFEEEGDENLRNNGGFTPFLLAAKYGHFSLCQSIIEKSKKLNSDLGNCNFTF